MAQFIFYSIVFFDPDDQHHHPGANIVYCDARRYLNHVLALHGQTRITVCVCCHNLRPVLNILHGSPNVAAIFLCSRHHPNQHGAANHPLIIRENLFHNNEYWQIDAHRYALDANGQRYINNHIRRILNRVLQQLSFPIHGATEETGLN